MNNAAQITLSSGINLSYSRANDKRVISAMPYGEAVLVKARSAKAAEELANEARAWGANAEIVAGKGLLVG